MESPGSGDAAAQAVVVVPVKAFDRAKGRLSGHLDEAERAALARTLAEVVLEAARPLPATVVCDDEAVADWARSAGAAVVWAPGTDLNGSVLAAVTRLEGAGVGRAVVAHADLPFARGLADLARADDDEVLLVADRHGDGTNVLSVPTGRGFRFHYGPGSCAAHRDEAARCGLEVRMVTDDHLAWDVDAPEDLDPPAALGPVPGVLR